MEAQIAQYFLWSVYINAGTLLLIVGLFGWYFRQIQKEVQAVAAIAREVAGMTREVARMTSEVLRRTPEH